MKFINGVASFIGKFGILGAVAVGCALGFLGAAAAHLILWLFI